MGSCPTEQFTETPAMTLPFFNLLGLGEGVGHILDLSLRSHKVMVVQAYSSIHTHGKDMAGRSSDTMGAHSLM